MMLSLFLGLTAAAAPSAAPASGLLAIRVGRAETVSQGTIEHAVLLVEGGKIVTIGEDLPIERGIPILDRPEWTVWPGLVSAYSRLGLDSQNSEDNSPQLRAFDEIYPEADELEDVVELGVTTLGLYAAGNGLAGQSCAVRPLGDTAEEMLLRPDCYLKIVLRASASSKKLLRNGFEKADEHAEKVAKAREKWEKDQEAKKKKKSSEKKDDAKKDEEKKEEEKPEPKADEKKEEAKDDVFTPPAADEKVEPFLRLRDGELRALVSVGGAAEYLHFVDALGEEKIGWDLRLPFTRETDLFYVLDKKTYELDVDGIGDRGCRVVVEPSLALHPGTMRNRNVPAELARAGAKLVFVPREDSLAGYRDWLRDVGEVIGAGLPRETAVRALTLEPAALLGVDDRVGSIEKGKDANLVFFDGDPFQTSTRIQAVMLDGRIVHEVSP